MKSQNTSLIRPRCFCSADGNRPIGFCAILCHFANGILPLGLVSKILSETFLSPIFWAHNLCRKRRFLESLGLRKQTSQVPSDTIFEDNDLAEAYLTAQAGLESEDNRCASILFQLLCHRPYVDWKVFDFFVASAQSCNRLIRQAIWNCFKLHAWIHPPKNRVTVAILDNFLPFENTVFVCRILLPDDWACNEEICHPLVAADENLFKRQLRPQRLSMRDQNHLSRAQSVQHW